MTVPASVFFPAVAPASRERALAAGEVLYAAGDPAGGFYVVLEGEVEAFAADRDGPAAIWLYGAGDYFGEHALLAGGAARTVGMRAAGGAARVLEVPPAVFAEHVAPRLTGQVTDKATLAAMADQHLMSLAILRGLALDGTRGHQLKLFAPGELVLAEGDTGGRAFFVVRGVARAERGAEVLRRMTAGHCFGELSEVSDGAEAAPAVRADTRLAVLAIEAPLFRTWAEQHLPLRALLATLRQIYRSPSGSTVTVGPGVHEGAPCITATVRYEDGRGYTTTKLVERDAIVWSRADATGHPETLEYTRAPRGVRRRLHLAGGKVAAFEVEGDPGNVASVCERLLGERVLSAAEKARFRWTGALGRPADGRGALLCVCLGLTREDAALLPEAGDPRALTARTGAGSFCGGCAMALEDLARGKQAPAPSLGARMRRLFGL